MFHALVPIHFHLLLEKSLVTEQTTHFNNQQTQAMERQRQHIKSLLQQTIQELGPLAAILPGGGEDTLKQELSALLQQLEQTAPNPGGFLYT